MAYIARHITIEGKIVHQATYPSKVSAEDLDAFIKDLVTNDDTLNTRRTKLLNASILCSGEQLKQAFDNAREELLRNNPELQRFIRGSSETQ